MKKVITLLLTLCMILTSFSACGDSEASPSTEPTLDKSAMEKMSASEILCAYFHDTVKANPQLDCKGLANRLSLHEFFDTMELNIYTQEWGNPDTSVYLTDFPENLEITQCDSVSTLSLFMNTDSVFAGYVFSLKEGEDAGAFCDFLKEKILLPQDTGKEIECEAATEGRFVFLVICEKGLKDSLGSNPNRKETPNYILRKLRAAANLGTLVQTIDATAEGSSYNTGVSSTQLIEKDAALSEPMVGYGFSIVLVKVKDQKDVDTVAAEMRSGLNPMKWICVGAESVQVVTHGQYVLGIMASTSECEQIAKTFSEMFS